MKNINKFISNVNTDEFTNNTQRVFFHLLAAKGEWVSGKKLNSIIRSASRRARELRQPEFGNFKIQCKRASEIGMDGDANTFYYRLVPKSVSVTRAKKLLGMK